MTIEATLERIAAALESLARSANTPAAEPPQAPPGPTGPAPIPETPPENTAPRPRGRPAPPRARRCPLRTYLRVAQP